MKRSFIALLLVSAFTVRAADVVLGRSSDLTWTGSGLNRVASWSSAWSPLALSPVAWWQGDGDAKDCVSTNVGTWAGTEAYADGHDGRQAFSFNGSSYVGMGMPSGLAISNTAVSLCAWVKITAFSSYQAVFGAGYLSAAVSGYGLYVSATGYNAQTRLNGANNTASVAYSYTGWTHLTEVCDANYVTLYTNGVYAAQVTRTVSVAPNYGWMAGARIDGAGVAFCMTGRIQDCLVFDRALTTNEIAEIYAYAQ